MESSSSSFPSSVSAYGLGPAGASNGGSALAAHTLPYAIHKKESDEVVRQRCTALRGCSVYILRPHIFAGASVENYLDGSVSRNSERERASGRRR